MVTDFTDGEEDVYPDYDTDAGFTVPRLCVVQVERHAQLAVRQNYEVEQQTLCATFVSNLMFGSSVKLEASWECAA
jgi:hypothetical protein